MIKITYLLRFGILHRSSFGLGLGSLSHNINKYDNSLDSHYTVKGILQNMQLVFIKKESSIDILTSYHICELVDSECVGVQSLCSSLVVCLYVI